MYGVLVRTVSRGVRYLILLPTAVCHGGVQRFAMVILSRCTVVWQISDSSSYRDLPRWCTAFYERLGLRLGLGVRYLYVCHSDVQLVWAC